MVVCTDSLWEHTIALPNSSIIDPYGHPLPEGGSPKIKFKTVLGCQGMLTVLTTL